MNMQFSYLAERCNCMQSSTIVMICSLSVCDASVLWQNGWSCLVYLFLLTYARKHTLSISFLKLCHSYILKKKLKKEPAYHHLTYCTFIPQWSDQYSNMPHRSGTLLWPSLKLCVQRLFNEGSLTLFFVTPLPPAIFLHWRWLTFHLSMQNVWISLSVYQENLSTWQLFTPPSPTPSRYGRDIPAQEANCIVS